MSIITISPNAAGQQSLFDFASPAVGPMDAPVYRPVPRRFFDDMVIVHPADLETAPPFSELFPVSSDLRAGIAGSIREFGYMKSKPIVVWRQRNVVVDGHARRLAAIDTGSDVVVFFRDFADEGAALEYAIESQLFRRN